jgi:endonuclease YncB( thermonuclease family)
MYEYKFTLSKVIDGGTIEGLIDLGFGVLLKERIRLHGIDAPEIKLQKSIKNPKERVLEKKKGIKAKLRLKELLSHGSSQPEGLFINSVLFQKGKRGRIIGDIKYVYAKDLYNMQEGQKPWTGWKSISSQLLEEGLVTQYNKR